MTGVISEDYRRLMAHLHREDAEFGSACVRWAPFVTKLATQRGFREVLDYGAGKGRLAALLAAAKTDRPITVYNYEPSNPEWCARPKPCEFVVCLDVLEHIEPEYLESVLCDLARCVLDTLFVTIAHGPARKVLADRRNAHLIQEPVAWWAPHMRRHVAVVAQWECRGVSSWLCSRRSR